MATAAAPSATITPGAEALFSVSSLSRVERMKLLRKQQQQQDEAIAQGENLEGERNRAQGSEIGPGVTDAALTTTTATAAVPAPGPSKFKFKFK